ncbi:uncharacterized protein LOC110645548 isoform X2 [Hevea brasiliensis]|uniref:uncharacterized protein LOC110645548 isoform X2 n=1 Tax=Hevea brasiliensis TaxID=3981 RepID=UPI0025D5F201|nr:uncharacterized protein LOC110645548 isoform X2 [Hevea brasiliensis]
MAIPNSAVLLFSVFFSCNWYWILLVIPVLAMLVFIACPLLALSSLVEVILVLISHVFKGIFVSFLSFILLYSLGCC